MALRAGGPRVRAGGQRARGDQRLHRGLRRGALDDRGRARQGRADAGHHRVAVRALLQPWQRRLHPPRTRRAARPVRRPPDAQGDGRVTTAQTRTEENPLVAGLERLPVHPTTLVIFGATGDLARRKLLPAIYNLAHEGALPERFHLIGVSRSEKQHEDFQAEAREAIAQFSRREADTTVLDALV